MFEHMPDSACDVNGYYISATIADTKDMDASDGENNR